MAYCFDAHAHASPRRRQQRVLFPAYGVPSASNASRTVVTGRLSQAERYMLRPMLFFARFLRRRIRYDIFLLHGGAERCTLVRASYRRYVMSPPRRRRALSSSHTSRYSVAACYHRVSPSFFKSLRLRLLLVVVAARQACGYCARSLRGSCCD